MSIFKDAVKQCNVTVGLSYCYDVKIWMITADSWSQYMNQGFTGAGVSGVPYNDDWMRPFGGGAAVAANSGEVDGRTLTTISASDLDQLDSYHGETPTSSGEVDQATGGPSLTTICATDLDQLDTCYDQPPTVGLVAPATTGPLPVNTSTFQQQYLGRLPLKYRYKQTAKNQENLTVSYQHSYNSGPPMN